MTANSTKPIVLHLGDPVKFNTELYAELESQFTIIRPSLEERQRDAFLQALRENKWGDFSAISRPWWTTGGEMGRWDQELIPLLPKSLAVFASAGAGYDWADVDVLAEHGVLYCNGASASSEAVADMAIYHIISVFRNMQWTNMASRTGDPEAFIDAHHNAPFTAHNPAGRTLGVIGLGNIGYKIAHKAYVAFGMRILYYDVVPKPAEQESAISARRCETLDELLARADCTVIAAPGQAGRKVVDREQIAKMKRGSRLVNVARGSLVNEEAVADALESGHLHAVGLDVFENEPHPSPRLVRNRQATLTCHTAGGALETTIGFERLAIENVLRVLTGQAPLTPVNSHLMK
ncbi:Glyoxylate reductase 1 [Cytospora mali]|uniref:Glyoxylate reductase 1 n=1 Tax=Cytospora mali TaxID=578113 RepID=A0A194UVF8_CYTMA|nr:Glyoxylate reductase 1 [Valsa mali var. pyri (nom. inval.)]